MAGSYDFEEQERIAAIQHWWEDNSRFVYGAVAAFILAVAGYKGWVYWSDLQTAEAAAMSAEIGKAGGDPKKTIERAQAVIDRHPGTFFASEAALVAAKVAFETGDLKVAQAQLEWVLDKGREEHKGVARVRLAAVLMDQKKYDEALKVLDGNKEEAFLGPVADLKGDIFFAQGRIDEARASYKLALEKSDPRSPLRSLTELKLGALGGAQ
jgi:predicted negative regulator of RcsB-dependent stress response